MSYIYTRYIGRDGRYIYGEREGGSREAKLNGARGRNKAPTSPPPPPRDLSDGSELV